MLAVIAFGCDVFLQKHSKNAFLLIAPECKLSCTVRRELLSHASIGILTYQAGTLSYQAITLLMLSNY